MLDKPRSEWTLEEARDRLEKVVEAALAGAPQMVSRDGKVAVVLSTQEYERLLADRRAQNRAFVEHLLSFPQLPEGEDDFVMERLPSRTRDIEF